MDIHEKINTTIKKQGLTKREFAKRLIQLEPRLKSTGNAPTEKTVYGYLNGKISINIELISYIVDVLDITEQELFDDTLKSKIKFLKYIINHTTEKEQEHICKCIDSEFLEKIYQKADVRQSAEEKIKLDLDEDLKKLIPLLHFAPKIMIQQLIEKLETIRNTILDI